MLQFPPHLKMRGTHAGCMGVVKLQAQRLARQASTVIARPGLCCPKRSLQANLLPILFTVHRMPRYTSTVSTVCQEPSDRLPYQVGPSCTHDGASSGRCWGLPQLERHAQRAIPTRCWLHMAQVRRNSTWGALWASHILYVARKRRSQPTLSCTWLHMVQVRRQFQERPGIMEYKEKPDYARCVSIVAASALRVRFRTIPLTLGFLKPSVTHHRRKPLVVFRSALNPFSDNLGRCWVWCLPALVRHSNASAPPLIAPSRGAHFATKLGIAAQTWCSVAAPHKQRVCLKTLRRAVPRMFYVSPTLTYACGALAAPSEYSGCTEMVQF